MASGRTSCTVGSYETAEVYSNASGGASSVTLNATSTDSTKCFKVSVNISPTSITPQTTSTVLCSCASVCSCLDYSQVTSVATQSDGTFMGLVCYMPDTLALAGYNSMFTYTRCTGERVCHIAGAGRCTWNEMGAPVPWLGSIPTHSTTDFVIPFNTCWQGAFRLQNFIPHGGTVETERACEWIAAGNCVQAAYCNCGCTDRDGCTGSCLCYAYRPNYGIYGASANMITACCNLYFLGSVDYWAKYKHYVNIGTSTACPNCLATNYSCIRCQLVSVAALTTQNSCQDNVVGSECMNHCFDYVHRCGPTANATSAICCVCSCHGNLQRARTQAWYKAMCNTVWMFALNGSTVSGFLRAKPSCELSPCMLYCFCNQGSCSQAKFVLEPDGTMPVKWATYNCIDGKNYFMWQHHNTPDWDGIYSIDTTQYNSIISHTCCCTCTFTCYAAGDEFPSSLATKVADLPEDWGSVNGKNTYFVNAHQVGPTCFVTLFGAFDTTCECFNMDRYHSADLKTWVKSDSDTLVYAASDDVAVSGNATCVDVITSAYGTLCNSGQIEHNTQGIQLERTGLVTSNGDKIYVKNTGDSPVSVSVWGYEE